MTARRLPWIRVYVEARNDSKLDALTDREHRIWLKLLLFSAETEPRGVVDYLDPEYVAMELRVTADELTNAIHRMARLRLVTIEDGFVTFPSFADRQYEKPSDAPERTRARKQESRARAKAAANVTPTSRPQSRPITESESNEDHNRSIAEAEAAGLTETELEGLGVEEIRARIRETLAASIAKTKGASND